MKKTAKLKTNLHEVIAEISTVSNTLLEEQQERVNDNQQDLAAAIDAINMETDHDISLNKYCSKTGQKVGQYSIQEYAMMQRIFDQDKLKFYLQNKSVEYIAPHWAYTDGKALKNLSEHDPYGYAVYSISILFAYYQKFLHKRKNGQRYVEYLPQTKTGGIMVTYDVIGRCQWLEHKVTAYNNISKYDLVLVLQFNEIVRRYLALIQSSKAHKIIKWSTTDIRTATASSMNFIRCIAEIKKNIEHVIKHEYRHKRIKQHLTYADIVSVRDIYVGHSNFRTQGKPKEMTDTDHIMNILKDYVPKSKLDGADMNWYQYSDPSQRIKPKQKAEEHKGELKIKISKPAEKVNLSTFFGGSK